MPMFDAFIVMSAWNCPWQLWWLSQNNLILQILLILSSNLLTLIMLTKSFIRSNFLSSWRAKCWDCLHELQNMMTLLSRFCWNKYATSVNPLATNCAFFKQILNLQTSKAWKKQAFHFSNGHFSMRSFFEFHFLDFEPKIQMGQLLAPSQKEFVLSCMECQKWPLREESLESSPFFPTPFLFLPHLLQERDLTICCHILSADENDQNEYPLCGTAIKLLTWFIWENNSN